MATTSSVTSNGTTLAIDGLVSGLNTTDLINSLMTAEAAPQTQLKSQLSTLQSTITDLQSLNTSVKAVADAATALAKPGALNLFSTTSSSSSITATAGSTAAPGSISFKVTQLAQGQVSVTAAQSAWTTNPPVLTIVGADGTQHEVTAASTSIADVVNAINGAKAGVTATQVPAGKDASGTQLYRMQLTSATGAANAFSLYDGSAASVTAGTATDVLAQPGAATVTTAQDAKVTLWAGTGAEQSISSSTNTFTGLLTGVDVTVSATTDTPQTVTIAKSATQVAAKFGSLLTSLSGVLATIASKSKVTTGTDANGNQTATGGSLTGDLTVRQVNDQLFSALSYPVGGVTTAKLGITINQDGTYTFDQNALAAALSSDTDGSIGAALQTISGRIATAATTASDPYTGTITAAITGDQSTAKQMTDSISDWDTRLSDRRAALETQYAGLETKLSALKSQASWLASQINGLSSNSSSS
jgi:flagellar hook-associated protein 2